MMSLLLVFIHIITTTLVLLAAVAYLTYFERKIIGYMQLRLGPNRVGMKGWLQPIADVIKLLSKEIIIPKDAQKNLFLLSPVLALTPSLAAWAVIPLSSTWCIAPEVPIGIMYILSMSSCMIYSILLAGWGSQSTYSFLGMLRAIAQTISYEIPMAFCMIAVILYSGKTNLIEIIQAQSGGIHQWFVLPLFPLFFIYWISGVAETNRAPFDLAEGESELVAGFHTEYAGAGFSLFFLAEYMNMILISVLTSIMFLGGWASPFDGSSLQLYCQFVPEIFWLVCKTSIFLFLYVWIRATFPRYRYDQLMNLGWKFFIPISLIWIMLISFFVAR